MSAFGTVDMNTRKAMEALFVTWKRPVPGMQDQHPVFPAETTYKIDVALSKFRNLQAQQDQQPRFGGRTFSPAPPGMPPAGQQWRNTATPPQNVPGWGPPQAYPGPYGGQPPPMDPRRQVRCVYTGGTRLLNLAQQPPAQQYPAPYAPPASIPPVPQSPFAPPPSQYGGASELTKLLTDIDRLVTQSRQELLPNPWDSALQGKLKALVALQEMLTTQSFGPDQLAAIQAQVAALKPAPPPSAAPHLPPQQVQQYAPPPQPSTPQFPPPQPNFLQSLFSQAPSATPVVTSQPYQPPPSVPPAVTRVVSPAPQQSAQSLGTNNLAALLAGFASRPQPSQAPTPQPPVPTPQLPFPLIPQPTQAADAPAPTGGLDLVALLRAQGLLPASTAATSTSTNTPLMAATHISTPTLQAALPVRQPLAQIKNDVQLTTASIKMPRHQLATSQLYDALPDQCSTCGRRFPRTETGKQMKTKHMDWHFKVKDPDAARRGVHRDWYIDERDWIAFREEDNAALESPSDGTAADGRANKGPGSAKKKEPKDRWVRVPDNKALAETPCPVCQEKFSLSWSVEANDFVWMDAMNVGGRIYHATCYEEVRGSTPEPGGVLGKRKTEGSPNGGDVKKSRG